MVGFQRFFNATKINEENSMPKIKLRKIAKGTVKTIDKSANLSKSIKDVGVRSKTAIVGISNAADSQNIAGGRNANNGTADSFAADKSTQYVGNAARYITKIHIVAQRKQKSISKILNGLFSKAENISKA